MITNTRPSLSIFGLLSVTLGILLAAVGAQAETVFTNTASGNWSTAANWGGNVQPASGGARDYTIIAKAVSAVVVATNDRPAGGDFLLNQLVYTNATGGSYTLFGTGNLIFTNNTSAAAPQVLQETSRPMTLTNAVVLGNNIAFAGSGMGAVIINRDITGAGSLTMNGNYELTLSGSNSFTGGITLNAGTLTPGGNKAYAFGNSANSVITLNGGTVGVTGGTLGAFTVPEGASVTMVPGGTMGSSSLNGSGTLTLQENTINSRNLGNMTNNFTGTMIVTNTISNAGVIRLPTIVTGGTNMSLVINGSDASHTTPVGSYSAIGYNIGALFGNAYGILQAEVSSVIWQIGWNTSNSTFNGTIQDNGSFMATLIKVGSGTLTLNGANTFSGLTTISNGLIAVGGNLALSTNLVTLAGGGLAGASGGGTLTNTINLKNSATFVAGTSSNLTLVGAITNSGELTKTGAGTLTLAGTNTYTNATTVSSGTLVVNGATTNSAITVDSGAALCGVGRVGTVMILSNATLSAGDTSAVGTLTATNLTLAEGAKVAWDYNASMSDLVTVNGSGYVPTNATVTVTGSGALPSLCPLFTFTVPPTGATDGDLKGWLITGSGAKPNMRAVRSGNNVSLVVPTGFILNFF
jgi:autotransporter-associated beta strand protein